MGKAEGQTNVLKIAHLINKLNSAQLSQIYYINTFYHERALASGHTLSMALLIKRAKAEGSGL